MWHQAADGVAIVESGGRMLGIVPIRYSTSTLIDSASCVPWLAAEGPLAYTPEDPPAFFAGEAEVRLVDPSRIRFLESVGCTVAT